MNKENDHLLTKQQAAQILASSVRTIERLINAGNLTKVKIRGAVKIRYSEVMKIVERGC